MLKSKFDCQIPVKVRVILDKIAQLLPNIAMANEVGYSFPHTYV